ncbi:matrixin family metalloprotease [Candidatus Pacearchaeota archaeon]|nr:matrixin family metalloprotease [Candidatus Pacearchaeota archaeon]
MNKDLKNVMAFIVVLIAISIVIHIFVSEREDYTEELQTDFINKSDVYGDFSNNIEDEFSNINLPHWTHAPITYKIINEKECGTYESRMIQKAFNEIENSTKGIIKFEKIDYSPDIEIRCSFIEDCYEKKIDMGNVGSDSYTKEITEKICGYDAGYAQITEFQNNRILKAEIELIGLAGFAETHNIGPSGFSVGRCGYPDLEIHEILHVFGYEHTEENRSIMSPIVDNSSRIGLATYGAGDCKDAIISIDDWIIKDLIKTYSK